MASSQAVARDHGGHSELLAVAAALRWSRPDLTGAVADHVLETAASGWDDASWLEAAGWAVHARSATGDGRETASAVLDIVARRGASMLDHAAADRLRVELAVLAAATGRSAAGRTLLTPVSVADTAPELRADAVLALARCAAQDRPDAVGGLIRKAEAIWSAMGDRRGDLGGAAASLVAATTQRRAGNAEAAADRAAVGLACLDRARGAGPAGPSRHLAAGLAAEWISGLLDSGRTADAREGCAPLEASLRATDRPSRQVALLRLAVARAVPESGTDTVIEALRQAARDAASSDAVDLEAVCWSTLGALQEKAGDVDSALESIRVGVDAQRVDRRRDERFRSALDAVVPAGSGVHADSAHTFDPAGTGPDRRRAAGGPVARDGYGDTARQETARDDIAFHDAADGDISRRDAGVGQRGVVRAEGGSGGYPLRGDDRQPSWDGGRNGSSHALPAGKVGSWSDWTPTSEPDPFDVQGWADDDARRAGPDPTAARRREPGDDTGRNRGNGGRAQPEPSTVDGRAPDPDDTGADGSESFAGYPWEGWTEESPIGHLLARSLQRGDPDTATPAPPPHADDARDTRGPSESGAAPTDPLDPWSTGRWSTGRHETNRPESDRGPADRQEADRWSADQQETDGQKSDRWTADRRGTDRRSAEQGTDRRSAGQQPAGRDRPSAHRTASPEPGGHRRRTESGDGPSDGDSAEPLDPRSLVSDPVGPQDRVGSSRRADGSGDDRADRSAAEFQEGPGDGTSDSSPSSWLQSALAELDRAWGTAPTPAGPDHGRAPEDPFVDGTSGTADSTAGTNATGGDALGRRTPDNGAEGCVIVIDLSRDGRRFAGRRAAAVVRTVAAELAANLPPGARLRHDDDNALSMVLPGWTHLESTEWMYRTLPAFFDGVAPSEDVPGAQLRATVHDVDGPVGAQLLQRLDAGPGRRGYATPEPDADPPAPPPAGWGRHEADGPTPFSDGLSSGDGHRTSDGRGGDSSRGSDDDRSSSDGRSGGGPRGDDGSRDGNEPRDDQGLFGDGFGGDTLFGDGPSGDGFGGDTLFGDGLGSDGLGGDGLGGDGARGGDVTPGGERRHRHSVTDPPAATGTTPTGDRAGASTPERPTASDGARPDPAASTDGLGLADLLAAALAEYRGM